MNVSPSLKWHPIEVLDARFQANLVALQTRDPSLADRLGTLKVSRPFFIGVEGDLLLLGTRGAGGFELLPNPVPPPAVRNLANQLFPQGSVSASVVIGGLGYGWMWDRVAKLPCQVSNAPSFRPPIYLLTGEIERLWAVLHTLDWRDLLADPRFPIFVGPDAVQQLQDHLIANPQFQRPKMCLRVEQQLWRETDFDQMLTAVNEAIDRQYGQILAELQEVYAGITYTQWVEKFRAGSLRVLGITSRYTTFLQHSMRDWLAGLAELGHETRLLIEPADHLMTGATGYGQSILDFRPDLIVVIDHYRKELGRVPEAIPFAMWVQDRLPHLFSASAGQAQGPRDYCLGFGRLHLAERFGYSAERFMSCTIGINERKQIAREAAPDELARYGCDVSYISHASTPSDVLVRNRLARGGSPEAARLTWDFHERMLAYFQGGGEAPSEPVLLRQLQASMSDTRVDLSSESAKDMIAFFTQEVNNAIFRHQALSWLAETGADLRIYGRGWEQHPKLGRFARGVAHNEQDVPRIHIASKINLQVIPTGAMHQRLLDGLAAGGFFLMRYTPGDAIGTPYRKLWEWCERNQIRDDQQMRARADGQARALIAEIDGLRGFDTATLDLRLYDCIKTMADDGFVSLANAVWPEHYPQVAFRNAGELREKIGFFLADASERRRIAQEMRAVIVERCSYANISSRLLRMISEDLVRSAGDAQSPVISQPNRVAA